MSQIKIMLFSPFWKQCFCLFERFGSERKIKRNEPCTVQNSFANLIFFLSKLWGSLQYARIFSYIFYFPKIRWPFKMRYTKSTTAMIHVQPKKMNKANTAMCNKDFVLKATDPRIRISVIQFTPGISISNAFNKRDCLLNHLSKFIP